MTNLNHLKLTETAIKNFLRFYKDDPAIAKEYLGDTLNVSKTQQRVWANRILAERGTPITQSIKSFEALTTTVKGNSKIVKLKRLFWDIETSPNIVFAWKAGYKLNIGYESILKERKIICIGYKWEDDEKATVLTWDKDQDDKAMLTKFLLVVAQADEVVHHNGDQFDMPWFRTRCLKHKLQPMPDYKGVDTLQWARSKFYFNSNKLDYIANYLGVGGKLHTGYSLWKEIVLNNCPESMAKMVKYCAQDVLLLQRVWARLRILVPVKTHAGVAAGKDKCSCSHCGSDDIAKSKTKVTAGGTIQHQMQCKKCGGYTTINESAYQLYQSKKKK